MPCVQILDEEKRVRAFDVLLTLDGQFSTRREKMFIVNQEQYNALVAAGVVEPPREADPEQLPRT